MSREWKVTALALLLLLVLVAFLVPVLRLAAIDVNSPAAKAARKQALDAIKRVEESTKGLGI